MQRITLQSVEKSPDCFRSKDFDLKNLFNQIAWIELTEFMWLQPHLNEDGEIEFNELDSDKLDDVSDMQGDEHTLLSITVENDLN